VLLILWITVVGHGHEDHHHHHDDVDGAVAGHPGHHEHDHDHDERDHAHAEHEHDHVHDQEDGEHHHHADKHRSGHSHHEHDHHLPSSKMGMPAGAYTSAFLMSVVSFVGVGLLVVLQMQSLEGIAMYTCLAFAGSVLVADALMHLLPHALEGKGHDEMAEVGMFAVAGAVGLLAVEQACHIFEHSHGHCIKAYGYANLIVEMMHNFIDGLAIGLAYLDGHDSGVMVSWAVAAHELPQELGDFMVLRSAGYSTLPLLAWNFAASLTCVLGVYVVDVIGREASARIQQNVMALTGGSFLALALNMIAPQIFELIDKQHQGKLGRITARAICLSIVLSAIYVMLLVGEMEAAHHEHGHDHGHGHGHSHHHHQHHDNTQHAHAEL